MKTDLSHSQVKALLAVAAKSRRPSADPYADLLEAATKPTTTVEELVRIKERAKVLIGEAADARHRDAATLLYHAAVAAAFVHHDAEISGRPMRKQQTIYERFAAKLAERPLGRLFREAAARLARTPPP
jgi:hypothetical protein